MISVICAFVILGAWAWAFWLDSTGGSGGNLPIELEPTFIMFCAAIIGLLGLFLI